MLKVIHLVQMSQEKVTDQHKVSSASLELIVVNGELATRALCLMKIHLRLHFKHLVAQLHADSADVLGDLLARMHALTEVIIDYAVDI